MLTPLALLLLTTTLAQAADPLASNLLPRASLPAARTVGVDVGAISTLASICSSPVPLEDGTDMGGGGCENTLISIGGPSLRADLPVGNRGALELRGSWLGAAGERDPVASAFLRVRAYGTEAVTVTPWVGGLKVLPVTSDDTGNPGIWAAGAALDAGGTHVRVDLSVPFVVLLEADGSTDFVPFGLPALFSEAGVRFRVAPGHTVRAGLASLAPGMAWRGEFKQVAVEVAVHGVYNVLLTRASVSKTF